MQFIIRPVTKDWIGPNQAATQLISISRRFVKGSGAVASIDTTHGGRAWARVLDARSATFHTGSPTYGDATTMTSTTDLLAVQFFADVSDESTRVLAAATRECDNVNEEARSHRKIAGYSCQEGSSVKKSTRLYWIAGITGAIVGTSALASASPGSDYSADSYDLVLLSDASIASPASALPDDFDFANLDDEIDPGTLRLVGTTGHASIFTAFSAAGELCVISSIEVSADDWTVGSACQSPDSFNARGAALRMTSPTESVEAYLLPDSAVAALRAAGHNLVHRRPRL